ncbi:uncharacterized protein L201_007619 [Kwoniella dendrophila CBS 6074]|uniref:Uncharacterized protein n=1 Tax=Kwoniella dendrophila CBS 6074 TaxID=1295534 RepID=A0AAX4K775_9TREE
MLTNGYEPATHPHTTSQQSNVTSTTTRETTDELGSRTITNIEENEVITELTNTPGEGDVEMNGEDGHVEQDEHDEEEDDEGDGEGSEDDEDDEDDEDEDEDDEEDDSGEESEDLGSPDVVAIDGPDGPPRLSLPPTVKLEPGTPGPSTVPTGENQSGEAIAPVEGAIGETNILVPKKKKRAKLRSPSEDEDLPPPPPPMKTIRLEKAMLVEGETLEWNILDDARDKGMVAEVWGVAEDPITDAIKENGEDGTMDVDNPHPLPIDGDPNGSLVNGNGNGHSRIPGEGVAGPSSGPLFGLGFGDEDPEEIARRLEEKYADEPKGKKAKIKRKQVDYDLEDPFIDDSEILIDAPTHFARPKKEGFFVHAGTLELLEESPQKPKPRTTKAKPRSSNPAPPPKDPRNSLSSALRSRKHRGRAFKGSQAQPISIDDSDGERNGGPSRARQNQGSLSPPPEEDDSDLADFHVAPFSANDRLRYKNASRDERYLPPWSTFPTDVRRRLLMLRSESDKQNWDPNNRSKFPENLKVFLQAAGEAAYEHDMFGLGDREGVDKEFWHAITSALPYNEFTIRKLCTKLCYSGYWKWLHDCEDEGIRQFGEMVEEDKAEMISKHDESHKKWEEEVKEWDEKHPNGAGPLTTSAPMAIDTLVDGAVGTPNPDSTPKLENTRPPEPPKRYPWTADMREVFEQLVENMYNMVDLTAKASQQEWNIAGAKQGKEWSETAIKQKLYKRIVEAFPEGYMNTSIISREMSRVNKKKAKQTEPEAGPEA